MPPAPMMVTTTSISSAELLQAKAELWCHTFAYLKSMALQSAIKLGIPTAIHRCGGAASLSELHLHLPIPASKVTCLRRLMKLLVASGIFRESKAGVYSLTPVSRLLVEDIGRGHTCLSQFTVMATSPFHFQASQCLAEWLKEEDDGAAETPFMMAHGAGFFAYIGRELKFGALFNEAMGEDSRFMAEILVRECGDVFAGLTSLVDVGGGDGTAAKAIAKAFPYVKCSVLELPQVVGNMPVDGVVEFVAGDMMEFVPPTDAALLKFVLHNWSDHSASKQTLEAQLLMDTCMMMLTTGEERDEEKWHKLFLDAGFSRYKINPILGSQSLIERLRRRSKR
ncbi:unnamed protein product [Urochloa decumbens]|uniref:Uncharacterized protein n=1 Tax=Urochloa decumbens TaxID=240449 RepID=A0ABC9EMX8_9POAL